AERAMERGDPDVAARHVRRWLDLSPLAAPKDRAAAALRLVDACALGDDAIGVGEALRAAPGAEGIALPYAGGTTSLAARAAAAAAELNARTAAKAAARLSRERAFVAEPLEVAWRADLADHGYAAAPGFFE